MLGLEFRSLARTSVLRAVGRKVLAEFLGNLSNCRKAKRKSVVVRQASVVTFVTLLTKCDAPPSAIGFKSRDAPFEILSSDLGTAGRLSVGWTSQAKRCNFVALQTITC